MKSILSIYVNETCPDYLKKSVNSRCTNESGDSRTRSGARRRHLPLSAHDGHLKIHDRCQNKGNTDGRPATAGANGIDDTLFTFMNISTEPLGQQSFGFPLARARAFALTQRYNLALLINFLCVRICSELSPPRTARRSQ